MSAAAILADIAETQLGVVEEPRGSNSGPRILEYQRATDLAGTGWPWCAAFVCWVIAQAMKTHPGIVWPPNFRLPKTALAHGFPTWARAAGCKVLIGGSLGIQRGDIAVYRFRHIGIVAKPPTDDGHGFDAIEGNTDPAGSREGYTVALQGRQRTSVRAFIQLPIELKR